MKLFSIILIFLTACSLLQGPAGNNSSTSSTKDYKIFFVKTISTLPFETAIASMSPDGTNEVTLFSNGGVNLCPAVSDDGSKVAFVSDNYYLYVMDVNGSNATQIYDASAIGVIEYPAFSPDGSLIYFDQSVGAYHQIYKMNSDGSGSAAALFSAGTKQYQYVRFSPNGSKIVFSSNRIDANYQIFSMVAAGSTVATRLTTSSDTDTFPSYNSDGSKIIFSRSDGSNSEIFMYSSAGLSQISSLGSSTLQKPQFSPDDSKIFYSRDNPNTNFFYLNLEDGTETQITHATSNLYSQLFVSKAVY